jgi:2-iminobutanoate/2-iminopropanoate deaminase
MFRVICTNKATQPIAPYSQAIKAGGFVFLSGAAAIDPDTGATPEGDVAKQTDLALRNLTPFWKRPVRASARWSR